MMVNFCSLTTRRTRGVGTIRSRSHQHGPEYKDDRRKRDWALTPSCAAASLPPSPPNKGGTPSDTSSRPQSQSTLDLTPIEAPDLTLHTHSREKKGKKIPGPYE